MTPSPSPFQKLHLQNSFGPAKGFEIKSPISGLVLSSPQSGEPAPNLSLQGDGVWIQIQENVVLAPFNGRFFRTDQMAQKCSFLHPNGFRLNLSFPPVCAETMGVGFHWQCGFNDEVRLGQPILQFDGAALQRLQNPLCCWVSIQDHSRFLRVLSRPAFMHAGKDTLFLIELNQTKTS